MWLYKILIGTLLIFKTFFCDSWFFSTIQDAGSDKLPSKEKNSSVLVLNFLPKTLAQEFEKPVEANESEIFFPNWEGKTRQVEVHWSNTEQKKLNLKIGKEMFVASVKLVIFFSSDILDRVVEIIERR